MEPQQQPQQQPQQPQQPNPTTMEEAFDAPVAASATYVANASASNRNEVDQMVATAHRYPRNIKTFRDEVRSLACLNEDVAEECTYALPRDGKTIIGPSARFAEICISSWGNCSAAARVVEDRGTHIVSQGVFMDHQKNTRIIKEVERRVTSKSGRRYSEDMVVVTGNAGNSIALRNAVFAGIPKAFWHDLWAESRKVAIGDQKTLANRRAVAFEKLGKHGATEPMILAKLERQSVEEVTLDDLAILLGAFQAIKEGDSTVEELFWVKSEGDAPPVPTATAGTTDLKAKLALRKKGSPAPATTGASEGPTEPAMTADALDALAASAPTVEKCNEYLDLARRLPEAERIAVGLTIAKRAFDLGQAAFKK